ncbi:hypothetical protein O0235_00035 [Tepidiforma flava]|uniref:Uncharacterized protein n=1 Tax=Tepidiforma flava TaxID=3004094 RepID=A0ABY7M6N2_9CHLR|nr:hypothetical protein [Tepidiforma flava]WBL36060.1 hypothetical protein O0235_00035 [Tepidiforma flava]
MLSHALGEGFGDFFEGGERVGVVLVGGPEHEAHGEVEGAAFLQREADGAEEGLGAIHDAPAAVFADERHVELALDREEVALDGALGVTGLAGELERGDAVGPPDEDVADADEAGRAAGLFGHLRSPPVVGLRSRTICRDGDNLCREHPAFRGLL